TAVAVLTLALGIGANTAIFTLVNSLLLKMLPVKAPQQLVIVGDPTRVNDRQNGTPETDYFSYPLYRELRDNNKVFTGLSAAGTQRHIEVDATATGGSSDEVVAGRLVSGNYFSVLGVDAAAGRLLTTDDDTAENANPVVALTYGYWKRKFALSPAIIGKEIRLNGYPFTVVGVTQPSFKSDVIGDQIDVFVPITMQQEIIRGAKLLKDPNASNLLLARATARSKEIAVRLALGAGRGRLLRQLLTESVLLALCGGVCGALLAIWGVRVLVKVFGSGASSLPLSPDMRVLLFTTTVCILTGILFGLAPALRSLKVQVTPTLKGSSAALQQPHSHVRWGKGLVVGQV